MCGIAGILRVHPPGQAPPPPEVAIPESWLDILDESIKHRGPDGHGRFRDRVIRSDGSIVDVALVHRRLSIIDHAGGHQPMVLLDGAASDRGDRASGRDTDRSRDRLHEGPNIPPGADPDPYRRTLEHALKPCPRCAALGRARIAVVFNGCIYNHRELRRELHAAGHEFSTDHSDTEVLVHGWGEWEWELYRRLNGMFALAMWDGMEGSWPCVRDTFGEKPLYRLSIGEDIKARCSTAAGLWRLQAALDRGELRSTRVQPWIRHGWALGEGGVRGILEVPRTGRAETTKEGAPAPGGFGLPHWLDWAGKSERPLDIDRTESLLKLAIQLRLEADVPLGCFLSGGIDSSLIAALATSISPGIDAFTVAMPDPRMDESGQARLIAQRLGLRHSVLPCRASPAEDLSRLIPQLGMPFGDSSLLPTHWLCEAVRSVAKVALAGDGGDELFAGYERHTIQPLAARLHRWARLVPAHALPSRDPRSKLAKLRRLVEASRMPQTMAPELAAIFPKSDLEQLVPVHDDFELGDLFLFAALRSNSPRLFDLDRYLPGDLLRKTDTASMAVPLEVRSPFLDPQLAEAAIGTPDALLMPRGQRKGLLRAVARKYFPPEIVDRPKQGFAIPIGEWFRTDYGGMRQLLLDHLEGPEPFGPDHLGIGPIINMAFVRQMLKEHDAAGQKSLWPWKGRDHSQRLYMLLVLSIWAKWLARL